MRRIGELGLLLLGKLIGFDLLAVRGLQFLELRLSYLVITFHGRLGERGGLAIGVNAVDERDVRQPIDGDKRQYSQRRTNAL